MLQYISKEKPVTHIWPTNLTLTIWPNWVRGAIVSGLIYGEKIQSGFLRSAVIYELALQLSRMLQAVTSRFNLFISLGASARVQAPVVGPGLRSPFLLTANPNPPGTKLHNMAQVATVTQTDRWLLQAAGIDISGNLQQNCNSHRNQTHDLLIPINLLTTVHTWFVCLTCICTVKKCNFEKLLRYIIQNDTMRQFCQ